MRIGVVGGGLQGLEAAYLARKADWEVRLLDRRGEAPARGLAHEFVQCDASDLESLERALQGVDLVLPALEDTPSLETLTRWAALSGVPLAFDLSAYAVSSSKRLSNSLFRRLGLAMPREGPECGLPLLAKPDGLSGSRGVRVFREEADWESWRRGQHDPAAWVVQEYLQGPSYSLEVLGRPEGYRPLQVTGLEMDGMLDCKRVRAPAVLEARLADGFARMAVDLAEAVKLHGVMDLEVILHEGQLKLLEIDARLPSQTPTVVYLSSGINMVELLGDVCCANIDPVTAKRSPLRGVVYEHIKVSEGKLEVCGEHIMTEGGPLSLRQDFFGADEAISNYEPGRPDWVATLIIVEDTRQKAWTRRCEVIDRIRRTFSIHTYLDPLPGGPPEDG